MITSLEKLEVEIKKGQQFEMFNPFCEAWLPILTKEIQQYDVSEFIDNGLLRVKQVKL